MPLDLINAFLSSLAFDYSDQQDTTLSSTDSIFAESAFSSAILQWSTKPPIGHSAM
jgi:hypothetical protein